MKIDGLTFNSTDLAAMPLKDALEHHTNSEGLMYAWRNKTPEQVKEDLTDAHARAVALHAPKTPKPNTDGNTKGDAGTVQTGKSSPTDKGGNNK